MSQFLPLIKLTLVTLLLLCFVSVGFAQNHGLIKGIVVDSLDKKPLELSTVAIVNVKDSALIAYTLAKKNGSFELSNLPGEKKMKLVITFASYKPFIKIFTLKKSETVDLGEVELGKKMLSEVVIRSERSPVTLNKDTIEFAAEAFKTRPNAVVEELLKKLPGVQVNGDGSIMVNGKTVSKVLIDGKQFFGNNLVIATKNLDADLISSVQVYDDREDDPDHLVSDSKVPKIINLKLKKAVKKSTFGKVFAGAGTRDRYESGGLFNTFRDTLQVSLIGLSNNLNRTAFSNDELYTQGGFDRSGGDNLYNGTVSAGGQNWSGIEKITSGGFNINTDYGKKLKMNLIYFYGQKNDVADNKALSQQFLHDTTLLNASTTKSKINTYSHTLTGLIDWKPDTLNTFHYVPKVSFVKNNSIYDGTGDSYNNFHQHLSESNNKSVNNSSSAQIQQEFYYNKRYNKKDESLLIGHSININPGHSDRYANNDIHSYLTSLQSDTIQRYSRGNTSTFSANIYGRFRYPLNKKLTLDVNTSETYNKSTLQSFVYDKDVTTDLYDQFSTNLSTNVRRNEWIEEFKMRINYNLTKNIKLVAGLNLKGQEVENKFASGSIFRNYLFYVPEVSIDAGSFSASFTQNITLPYLAYLQPGTMVYSSLYAQTGNPLLKPSTNNNVNIDYNKYFTGAQLNLYVYGNYSAEENGIVRVQTVANNGAQTTSFVNRDGQQRLYATIGVNKQFKKRGQWQVNTNTRFTANTDHSLNILNGVTGWQNSRSYSINQGGSLNWNDIVELNASGGYNFSHTYYEYGDYKKINTSDFNSNNNIIIRWPARMIWETKQDFIYNPLVSPGIQKGINVISSSVALQMLKKNRGEMKITAYDIFDQHVNVYRFTGNNSITDFQNNTLKRYFLLTVTYKFSHINTQ